MLLLLAALVSIQVSLKDSFYLLSPRKYDALDTFRLNLNPFPLLFYLDTKFTALVSSLVRT